MPKKRRKLPGSTKKMTKETLAEVRKMADKRAIRSARKPVEEPHKRMLRTGGKISEADSIIKHHKFREKWTRPTKVVTPKNPKNFPEGYSYEEHKRAGARDLGLGSPKQRVERAKRLIEIKEAKGKGLKPEKREVTSRFTKAKSIEGKVSRYKQAAKILKRIVKKGAPAAIATTGGVGAFRVLQKALEVETVSAPDLPQEELDKKHAHNFKILEARKKQLPGKKKK